MPNEDDTILNGKYTLIRELARKNDRTSWLARNEYHNEVLVKTWEYAGNQPDAVQRALWNIELRNLFRLSSLPNADACLTTIRDAGICPPTVGAMGYFALVLNVSGFRTLGDVLADRSQHAWLTELDSNTARAQVWIDLSTIATGLSKLHECQMLHRTISPHAIHVSATSEPSSMRLGGFEWTLRVNAADVTTRLPDDAVSAPFSFESDWFAFGTILAQVFAGVDPSVCNEQSANSLIRSIKNSGISDREQQLIIHLVAPTRTTRLVRAIDIMSEMDRIVDALAAPPPSVDTYLTLICALGPGQSLSESVVDKMHELNAESDVSALHVSAQTEFIRSDLKFPKVVRFPNGNTFALIGEHLTYSIRGFESDDVTADSWQLAFSGTAGEIRFTQGDDDQFKLEDVTIAVFDVKSFHKQRRDILHQALCWKRHLPLKVEQESVDRISRFHEFFRITNQIDVLMLDAQIFGYKLVSYENKNGLEKCVVEEVDRDHPEFLKRFSMMTLIAQQAAERDDARYVYLGDEPSLRLPRRIEQSEYWEVRDADPSKGTLELYRVYNRDVPGPKEDGYLRMRGMFGQAHLVVRRNQAIERLGQHAYLLRSFLDPLHHYIDTQEEELPESLDHDSPERISLDTAKRDALHAIWRTRPLFALQGPPGTGKTTLVASMLRQVFADSDVAKVLVTAQAHPAVDVLREKVRTELGISHDNNSLDAPLCLRIPRPSDAQPLDTEVTDPEYPIPLTRKILLHAKARLEDAGSPPIVVRWRSRIDILLNGLSGADLDGGASDFVELVKRSANITYSSTTSAALAELALSPVGFDWSIIEEAGRAHGFDLVLPLQNAHRWLLIGDQNQLDPYRFSDFEEALSKVELVMERLQYLPKGGALVDYDLLKSWKSASKEERDRRKREWAKWLNVFAHVFDRCEELKATDIEEKAHISSMLWQQHRMHPVIGELISLAFYKGKISSMTQVNDVPMDRVVHKFTNPSAIRGCSIVWLDIDNLTGKTPSEETSRGFYTSSVETDAVKRFLAALKCEDSILQELAVLSPYKAQVRELSDALRSFYSRPPGWLKPLAKGEYPANTVDSFQGNEADVVVVSLVRNNLKEMPHAFGFLTDRSRMNVLLSRAEKLMVLVGSWSFFVTSLEGVSDHETEPLSPWKRSIEYLKKCFENGNAALVDAALLPEVKS